MSAEFPGGEGIFETLKTHRGRPFALTRHLDRAYRSANILGLTMPTRMDVELSIDALLERTPEFSEFGRLRLSFHRSGEFDLTHETYHPWTKPARLTFLNSRINETAPTIGIKTLPFTEHLRCLEIARTAGFDDGIRFNLKEEICESAIANLLIKIGGNWITPPLSSGCLPGITRSLVLEWFDVREERLTRDDVPNIEAMYLLSSLKDAQPVELLDTQVLEIESQLGEELRARMGENIDP